MLSLTFLSSRKVESSRSTRDERRRATHNEGMFDFKAQFVILLIRKNLKKPINFTPKCLSKKTNSRKYSLP